MEGDGSRVSGWPDKVAILSTTAERGGQAPHWDVDDTCRAIGGSEGSYELTRLVEDLHIRIASARILARNAPTPGALNNDGSLSAMANRDRRVSEGCLPLLLMLASRNPFRSPRCWYDEREEMNMVIHNGEAIPLISAPGSELFLKTRSALPGED